MKNGQRKALNKVIYARATIDARYKLNVNKAEKLKLLFARIYNAFKTRDLRRSSPLNKDSKSCPRTCQKTNHQRSSSIISLHI